MSCGFNRNRAMGEVGESGWCDTEVLRSRHDSQFHSPVFGSDRNKPGGGMSSPIGSHERWHTSMTFRREPPERPGRAVSPQLTPSR